MSRSTLDYGSELDALLVEAFHAYRQGLHRQPQPHSPMPPRDFDALMFLGTIGWVPPESRLQLRSLNSACSKGLTAARQGRLDEALRHYEHAWERLERLEDATRLAWLLGVSTYQAGVAYLDFRRGCIQHACERLDRAMDADLELEQAGLPVMQMHRIQQGHNLARMDFRMQRCEPAVRLTGVLLAYLEHQVYELPYHRDWRPRELQAVPRSLLRSMIHQILGETAGYIVTGDATSEEWRLLIETSRLCRNPETAIFPQAQYALWAQSDRLGNNSEGYLRNLKRFFRSGIRHCHLLWYAAMIELVGFCREMDTRHSRRVRDAILRDSSKWKNLPYSLRSYLDHSEMQRNVA